MVGIVMAKSASIVHSDMPHDTANRVVHPSTAAHWRRPSTDTRSREHFGLLGIAYYLGVI